MNEANNTQAANTKVESNEPGFFSKAWTVVTTHVSSNRAKYGVVIGALLGVGGMAANEAYQTRRIGN